MKDKSIKNKYLVVGNEVKIYIKSPKYGLKVMLIDLEDLHKIKDKVNSITLWVQKHNTYAACKIEQKNYAIHRVILDYPEGLYIDHINHNGLDNRKSNLRICNNMINQQNRKVNKNSKSGVIGVNWHPDGYWVAKIKANKKNISLGYFRNKKEAIQARKIAELKYFTKIQALKKEANNEK